MAGQTPGSAGAGLKRIFATGLTETLSYDAEGVGAIRFEGNKIYKYVKYNKGAGSIAAIVGDVAYYYALAGDGVSGGYKNNEVTMDRTDGLVAAGVLQAIIADTEFGWIQIKGPATLTQALTAGADGNKLSEVGAGADGALDVAALVTDGHVAIAFDASAKDIICDFPF